MEKNGLVYVNFTRDYKSRIKISFFGMIVNLVLTILSLFLAAIIYLKYIDSQNIPGYASSLTFGILLSGAVTLSLVYTAYFLGSFMELVSRKRKLAKVVSKNVKSLSEVYALPIINREQVRSVSQAYSVVLAERKR